MKRKIEVPKANTNAPTPLWEHIAERIRTSQVDDDSDSTWHRNACVLSVKSVGQDMQPYGLGVDFIV